VYQSSSSSCLLLDLQAAGEKSQPSIAAVVGSMDRYAARYSGAIRMQGEKTALFEMPFIYKNQHFAKTGSGRT
jgi:hypothetical protein